VKLSIVTISRDDPEGLERTLLSASRLRACPGVEHVLIDGSGPHVVSRVIEVARTCGVRYTWQEPAGISAAFNAGLAEASGEWLWYLNGGDTVEADLDEQMLLTLLDQSAAEVAIFRVRMPEGPAQMERPVMHFLWPPVVNWIPHPAAIVRRKAIAAVGGFSTDYSLAMDGEFWIRLMGGGARADIIPLTISYFAAGGVSGDARSVASEVERMIWQHKRLLLYRWLQQGMRIVRAWYSFRSLSRRKS
jgi:glycosyltransferase involved in cell wall biosynthesis